MYEEHDLTNSCVKVFPYSFESTCVHRHIYIYIYTPIHALMLISYYIYSVNHGFDHIVVIV